jgi:hypothetical protein
MTNPLIGYSGAANVEIPFCGSKGVGAGKEKGPYKETIRMSGVSFPGKKGK